MSARWIALFALAWMGIWLAQLTAFQLLLPQQINDSLGIGEILREDNWRRSVTDFGLISGLSGIFAAVGFPLTGALSDRTTSRFGRRRPWIFTGSIVFALSLAALGDQRTVVGIGICWCLVIFGFSMVSAALTAMIGDRVPHGQRGVVSSWVSAPQAIGLIGGLALITMLSPGRFAGYLASAAVLLVCVVPFIWATPDPAVRVPPRERESAWALLRVGDFSWTLAGRILVNLGNALGTSLLLFYMQFELRISDVDAALLGLTVAYMVFAIAVSIVGGILSDRTGRRKPFVLGAVALQSFASVVIIVSGNLWGTMIAGALMGAGFGCFMAIDQALAADVLPGGEHSGQELGIMNVAMAVPQALGPLIGAWVVDVFGFRGLFVAAGVAAVAGGATVLRVKSVR
ncbi:MFS transporter [Nocardia sp. NPDC050630]|uniref:MFS transporter n=1 Tax=Nocardia sp. NPDC050630 TaxID=3364321 RepID=UPI0037A288B3